MNRLTGWLLRLYKGYLERQMKPEFDPILSRKLDCILYLLEN